LPVFGNVHPEPVGPWCQITLVAANSNLIEPLSGWVKRFKRSWPADRILFGKTFKALSEILKSDPRRKRKRAYPNQDNSGHRMSADWAPRRSGRRLAAFLHYLISG
jgi:hypothetical protein